MNPSHRRADGAVSVRWAVWIFPIIAALIAGKIFWREFERRGPTVRVAFDDATGIRAEKTGVRFRGVEIGRVNRVTISEDNKDVIAHVVLHRDARQFAVAGSKFVLIVPQVGLQGVTGLETLFEGSYISLIPGPPKGEYREEFRGQVGMETNEPIDGTVPYWLETAFADAITVGDSVTFRGVKIGSVTKVVLSKTSQSVLIQVNIREKDVRVIRNNTFFWRKIAVQAQLGLFKSELKISSLDSLINGGIEVFTPDDAGPLAKAGAKFPLWAAPPKDWRRWNPRLEF